MGAHAKNLGQSTMDHGIDRKLPVELGATVGQFDPLARNRWIEIEFQLLVETHERAKPQHLIARKLTGKARFSGAFPG